MVQELILTFLRLGNTSSAAVDESVVENRFNNVKGMIAYTVVEEILVVQRRMMLGAMRDPMTAVLTIIFTALEEAALRCTLTYRDELWIWLMGLPTPSEMEMENNRRLGELVGCC